MAPSTLFAPPARPLLLAALLAALLLAAQASASALNPQARQEIEALMQTLAQSGCEFVRGGKAHSGGEALAHMKMKLDYLDMRQQIASAEDFIAKAASRSSMTGRPYAVRCGGQSQPSEDWLKARLATLRQGAGK
jgi:hypothetical protein